MALIFVIAFTAGFTWYTPPVYAPVRYVPSYVELKKNEDTNNIKTVIKNPVVKRFYASVSAYLPMDPLQSSMTGLARDGNPAVPFRTIAVDPRVIPFYSHVYVPGVGWFIAHDTGNGIKGNMVDMCVEDYSWAMRWGRRTLEITVIEPED